MTLKHTVWLATFATTLGLGAAAYAQDPTTTPSPATPEQRDTMPPTQQSTEPDVTSPSDTTADPSTTHPSTTDTAPGPTAAKTPIDDKKIEQFADAYLAVQAIQQNAANELQTTTDPAAADQVKQKAESAMIAAVEKSGLQVDEFNHIVETMAADANVRERVTAELQERSGGG